MDKNQILKRKIIEAWERYVNQTYTCNDLALILDSIMTDDHIEEFNDVFNRVVWNNAENDVQPTPEEKEIFRKEFAQLFAEYESKKAKLTIQPPAQKKTVRFLKTWYAAAAAVLLLCFSIPAAYLYLNPKSEQISVQYVEEITERGEIKTLLLPDRTEVTLNAGSRLKYPANFSNGERSVELYGEALFDVISDPARPFTVKTENMNIKVVGTVFGVKEYADDLSALVSVASGKVEVETWRAASVLLEKNQQLKIDRTTGFFEKNTCDADNYLSWKDGALYFHRTPISEVLNILNRHYPKVDIDLAEIEYNSLMFTGKFYKENNPDNIIKGIAYTLGLKYKKTGNKYVLYNEE